jgi:YVTN family beta-propeller protein
MAAQPTGTVTLLFTDVEGSTRLLERLGRDRYAEGLEHHRSLLRDSFGRHRGFEVSCEGDSFFVAFPRAEDAVRAAADAQRALHETTWPHDLPFPVRMGIHTGEPKVVAPNYVGLDVHRAARVMSVSSGGQVLVAARTTDLVDGELPDGIALRQLGRFVLKDFDRPEPLAELVLDGLPAELPPPRAERAPDKPGSRRRRIAIATALLVVVAGAAIAAVLLTRSGAVATSNVVVSLDTRTGSVVRRTSVGNSPTSIAAGAGGVWVVNDADGTVSQLDESGKLVRTFGTTGAPGALTTSRAAAWIGNQPDTILRLDPGSGNTTATVALHLPDLSFGPFMGLAVARGRLWITAEGRLVTIDLTTLRTVTKKLPPPDWGPIAVTSTAVWESTNTSLYHLDANGRRLLASVAVPLGPLIGADDYIWVVNADQNVVVQVDPRTNTIVRTVDVGQGPTGIAFGDGRLWVASSDGTVTAIDPATARVTQTIHVGGSPQGVAVGFGRVWVAAS